MHKFARQNTLWGLQEKRTESCEFVYIYNTGQSFDGMAGRKERDQVPQTVYQKMRKWNV
jgi:hypothetical protein